MENKEFDISMINLSSKLPKSSEGLVIRNQTPLNDLGTFNFKHW